MATLSMVDKRGAIRMQDAHYAPPALDELNDGHAIVGIKPSDLNNIAETIPP